MTLDELRDEFDRSVTDQIAIADRALAVADAIRNADPDALVFRGLFQHLLSTQADAVILALGKLFDPKSEQYPTRSILGFLDLLDNRASGLTIYHREEIEEFVFKETSSNTQPLPDQDLTDKFVGAYRNHLDDEYALSIDDPPNVLRRIRTRRNKVVAHNENWRPKVDDIVSWQDISALLDVAKKFAGLVGPAYLNFHYTANDGTYMLTKSSRMVGTQMSRLIEVVAASMAGSDVS